MSVTVANRLIQFAPGLSQAPTNLSIVGRMVLAFIDGGVQWLQWAANEPTARYDLPDESALMQAIQTGLHDYPYTLLPNLGLLVSPNKLMTMGQTDLTTLASAETGTQSATVGLMTQRMFAAQGLVTQSQVAAAAAFLAEIGVGDAAVLQSMGLMDRLAVAELMRLPDLPGAGLPSLQKEAAAFGVRQSRTPMEFVDYYQVYLHQAAKLTSNATSDQREAIAETAVQNLQPLLFGALDCPEVDGLVAPAEVAAAVNRWILMGRQVGFARLSQGVLQIVQQSAYVDQGGDDARRMVSNYLARAQNFLAANAPSRPVMGQDGASCIFPVETSDTQAALHLAPGGAITLTAYSTKPPQGSASTMAVANPTLATTV